MAGPRSAISGFFAAFALFCVAGLYFCCSPWPSGDVVEDEPVTDVAEPDQDVASDEGAPVPDEEFEAEVAEPGPDAIGVTLVRVVDGDSLEMEIDGEVVDVRLPGMNAPELFGDDGQTCNGAAAKEALQELIEGRDLLLVGDEVDRFGRRLADVFFLSDEVDGDIETLSAVETLVGDGNGLATGEAPELRDLMKAAAAANRGLWGDRCGARGDASLIVTDSQVDPPGSDRDNLNDEWIVVANVSDETIDLDGWVISDDTTGHRFALDGQLEAGAELIVRTGDGPRSNGEFHLGESFPVWSNRGETVLLTDQRGVVSSWSFIDP